MSMLAELRIRARRLLFGAFRGGDRRGPPREVNGAPPVAWLQLV
jgi:hypothetical protein